MELAPISLLEPSSVMEERITFKWLICQDTEPPKQSAWVHLDANSGQIIERLQILETKSTTSGLLLNILASVIYRYSYRNEFELHLATSIEPNTKIASEKIRFVRIKYANHTQCSFSDLNSIIDKALSSFDSRTLSTGVSFESAFCLVKGERQDGLCLETIKQSFKKRKGLIWLLLEQVDFGYQLKWLCDEQVSVSVIVRLQNHMLSLIDETCKYPDKPLSHLTILSKKEIRQQLEFSKGVICKDQTKPLYKTIEMHARTRAREIAVIFESSQLTFQQLNQRANYLAHALLAKSIAPGNSIAVHIVPSANILVAILAIHKVGAIYVPIDPGFPATRIGAILEEVNPAVILCDESKHHIPQGFANTCADITRQIDLTISNVDPVVEVPVDSISHIYFTSGTTGKPKGVVATHKNLIHYISAGLNRYQINENDRFIAAARFTFSISMFELLTSLVAGGSVHILTRDQVLDLDKLSRAVEASTVFHFGPSLLKQLLPYIEDNYSSFKTFDGLRHVSSGGDMISPEILEQLKKIFRMAEVFVIYGSSEISVMGCTFEVFRAEKMTRTLVGRPHQNTTVRLFDKDGNMVPIGVTGQLYFAGRGLIKGYLNLPELTKEKFRMVDGERFYSIGDVGRLDHNGNIELLGREDFQIQVRGIRVELAEVDSYLRRTPGVKDAVAVATNLDNGDEKSIVAYVVFNKNKALSAAEMKKHLEQYLPEYMVPAAYIQLDALPLNHNMKVDRNVLPKPSRRILLRNQTQQIHLAKTLNRLIDIFDKTCASGISSDDAALDFYALGIESISLMKIRLAIYKQFNQKLSLKILQQEQSSIQSLATYLDNNEATLDNEVDLDVEKIKIVSRDKPIQASFAQQRLWFIDQLLGSSSLYNIPWAIRLKGKLDIIALTQSFREIIKRQESLRTCFSEHDGQLYQIITERSSFKLKQINISKSVGGNSVKEEQRILEQEANKVFNLGQPPLVRAMLLKISEQEHVLSVTMHHSISDGWSINLFESELAGSYNAQLHKENAPLPQLSIQYVDYSIWRRNQSKEDLLENQLNYWKIQLANVETLELPSDRSRPKQLTYEGGQESIELSGKLTQQIQVVSQDNGVSLFMTLLAAFQTLLHRYCGQEDIAVGSPIAGRNHEEIENLIGIFINTLVLRSDLSGNPRFTDLLQDVRQTCIEAYAHQDIPFENLVTELQPQRELNRQPLFQVMLNLLPASEQGAQFEGLTMERIPVKLNSVHYDLSLSLREVVGGLRGYLDYSTELFDAATITQFIEHFITLLEGIVANPNTNIGELAILTSIERKQLLIDQNDTEMDFPREQTIVDMFERQVDETPDNIAVVFNDRQLTYQLLNEKANQLAHYLLALSERSDHKRIEGKLLIAIAVERSLDMSIGMLAILKSGAAYIPIDPEYPTTRVHYMLNDSEASILLTQSDLIAGLSLDTLLHECTAICIDTVDINQPSNANLKLKRRAEDLAYVIYTSGSTGKPKAVMIEHHSLSNFLLDMKKRIDIQPKDRLLAVTTLSFDIAALEFYLPLISGGSVYISSRAVAADGKALQEQLAKYSINFMQATPITWELLKASNWQPNKHLNILCGGEALSPQLSQFLSANGNRVWNLYGPTETTIWSSAYTVPRNLESGVVPRIGQPISNTRVYILNAENQLQPENTPGELCIAGEGLARGYLKRPKLTAKKFLNIEINGKTERIYKTGDLARWLPEGNLECLGRIDHQIKLRGYRIELGEVESVLAQELKVSNAVVIVREDKPGDERLVAYLTHYEDEVPKVDKLCLLLKEKLPSYMIPSAFVLLEKFPLTPNGKIARDALPAPDNIFGESSQVYVPASTATEEKLVSIWESVLDIKKIGMHDDFFDLGGHSLLVIRLLTQVEIAFNKDITIASFFQNSTIAQFVELLSSGETAEFSDEPVYLGGISPVSNQRDSKPNLFCIYGVFLYQDLAKQLEKDASVYGVYIQEEIDLIKSDSMSDSSVQDVAEIATRYIAQIRAVQEKGPYYLAGASFGGIVAYEIAQQLIAKGDAVNSLNLFDAMSPFGFKRSLSRYIIHHGQRVMSTGVPYLVKKLLNKKQVASKVATNENNFLNIDDKDIRAMVRKSIIGSFDPQPYPGEINLFRVKHAVNWAGYKIDPFYGWRQFAEKGVKLVEISSDHLGMLKEPHVKKIADNLKKGF